MRQSITALLLAGAWSLAGALPGAAQPVVQPLPSPASGELREALQNLARDPESIDALLAAGEASLELDDIESAKGFFYRANAAAPGNGRAKAGLATIAIRQERPVEALGLFAEAEAAGQDMAPYVGDWALAYDLVGDNLSAQELYRQALRRGAGPLILRRYAISLAISGDQQASDDMLLPMLQREDLAAFRARAFALAILGKDDEAVSIAETMLPARLAGRLTPYLRYLPRLTRAQQAAAANLGVFPSASQIGRDPPEIAAFSQGPPARLPPPSADSRLVPSGQPLGPRAAAPSSIGEPRAPAGSGGVANAFSDLSLADAQRSSVRLEAEAVDLNSFEAPRETAPPAHPSRHWVQVATGREVSALSFDWRRIERRANGLLDGMEPHIASWGRTNRLLVGPVDSTEEANRLVTALKGEGIDTFRFTSEEGQQINPLD